MRLKQPGEETYPIFWHWETLGGIPCLIVEPRGENREIFCMYYHGWSSSPTNQLLRLQLLAMHGLKVVAPCAKHHGKRGAVDYENPEMIAKYLFDTVEEALHEFPTIMKEIDKIGKVGTRKICLYGNSMGGFIASKIFAEHPEIYACALTNTTWHWKELIEYWRSMYLEQRPIQFRLEEVSVEQLGKRPLWVSGGSLDPVVPQTGMRKTVEAMKIKGYPAEYLNFEGLGHFVTVNMLTEVISFYARCMG